MTLPVLLRLAAIKCSFVAFFQKHSFSAAITFCYRNTSTSLFGSGQYGFVFFIYAVIKFIVI